MNKSNINRFRSVKRLVSWDMSLNEANLEKVKRDKVDGWVHGSGKIEKCVD